MSNRTLPTAAAQPQVIAVHGSASSGRQWRRLAEDLNPHFNVMMPDLPGYGASANVVPFGPASLAGDAMALEQLTEAAVAPVNLVAHSYGAAVALNFACRNPQRVQSLVLIEPALFHLLRNGGPEDMAAFTEISAIGDAVRIAMQNGMPEVGMARFVDYWNGAGTWASMKPALREGLAKQTRAVARNFTAAMAENWSPTACREISCPVVFITAEKSRTPALRVSDRLHEAMPHARMIRVPDAGHMVPVTHPHLINPLIAEVLTAATDGGSKASHREAA